MHELGMLFGKIWAIVGIVGFFGLFLYRVKDNESELDEWSEYIDKELKKIDYREVFNKLASDGMCILVADKDNQYDIIEKTPNNFPYVIIYPNETDSEYIELALYAESLWEGFVEHYSGRVVPKWKDIRPKEISSDSSFIYGNVNRLLGSGHSYSLEDDYRGKRTIIDKWGSVFDDGSLKPKSNVRLNMGFMPE